MTPNGTGVQTGASSARDAQLGLRTKVGFALGDHTVNLVISAGSLLYLHFLTEVVGLRPLLAGAVVWVARVVDAFTDPAMGRISDLTRWRAGRRRPYFLIGALPFGVCFALMWMAAPVSGDAARFAWYSAVYVSLSLWMTCLSVPYLALLPEMATSYDERTSLNAFRAGAAVLGTLAAVGMKALVESLGGDAAAWRSAGLAAGVWLVLPWLVVYRVSFERPEYRRRAHMSFRQGARLLTGHRSYRSLCGLYILARVAVDLLGAMLLFYFASWIGREPDFKRALLLFLMVVLASLPVWLRVARTRDKREVFAFGMLWWIAIQLVVYAAEPSWPRWTIFALAALAAVGYAVADLMPWAMLGDVIDEDELATGERREGVYVGFFAFLRKLGGATAFLLVGAVLDAAGYQGGVPREEQTDLALQAVRGMTGLAPVAMLAASLWVSRAYSLGRAEHAAILETLERQRVG